MAESAVSFLLDHLLAMIEAKVKLLKGLRKEVKSIVVELRTMKAFLKDADARSETEEAVKLWVKDVREVAYDMEDVLDEFMFRFAEQGEHQSHGFIISYIHKISRFIKNFKTRQSLATQIQDIKAQIQNVSERRKRYKLKSLEQAPSSRSSSGAMFHDIREDALLLHETDLVGIEKPKEEITGWLVEGQSSLGVISVVGMGGLGKTTLVRKVYDDQRVKGHFQSHVWVTFSESPRIHELLIHMTKQIYEEHHQPIPHGVETMEDAKLKQLLQEFLKQKRYVIVVDDIWSIQAWKSIEHVFPDTDSNRGSRIMITTRSKVVAESCMKSHLHVYTLKTLSQKKSWTLFCNKTFRSSPDHSCPTHLEELSQSIVRKCGGLPLAIVTVGGVLSTKQKTEMDWEMFDRSLATELYEDDSLRSMVKILTLSYNDLPYHLKSCFLCLSMFPEDELIDKTRLIRIWMAEGFIQRKEGKTLEEIGESYLYELVNRSLIQIAETSDFDGRVKKCRVHDLIREIILSKAREQNFGTIIKQDQDVKVDNEKIRRLSFHHSCELVPQQEESITHLRSLFTFNVSTLSDTFRSGAFFSRLELLKVLDLRNAPLNEFLEEFTNLFHLKYLSLRNTNIKQIPDSIKKLQNLETLDLKQTYVSELPIGILSLHKLRHLLVYYRTTDFASGTFDEYLGFKAPNGIGVLESLQKLSFMIANTASVLIKELGRLVQLRKLWIMMLKREDGIHLCSSIEKMSCLKSLAVTAIEESEILDLESLSSPPRFLRKLALVGRLQSLPHWIPSLRSLSSIALAGAKLKDDPLEALNGLPDLRVLSLGDAYQGEQLRFQSGGFQRLTYLILNSLGGLRMVTMEEGSLPNLERIEITYCRILEKVPSGIERLTKLEEILFCNMPDEFRLKMWYNGEDHAKVAHVPSVRFPNWIDGQWEIYDLNDTASARRKLLLV
ncbi:PREDICTED: disease resistance protein RPM1-like [Nelumbo nucifera]|uniref:Disease resistance protein RPM1-like n=2 Tax=Nelumbo nucifera TaxID=4432 RepID=A0A1U8Q8C3_NELNU|nr:PREDICTED: disease resistance protein RPM1-like [Nelumbo nucifera]XP_019055044.1 PREDICTED: disease resistance protein RPM1-like [Nelumbo nucifera]DAD42836.1 TPA_asm: hypothetical protein HUJ06_001066 [Nelumbo nucifera]